MRGKGGGRLALRHMDVEHDEDEIRLAGDDPRVAGPSAVHDRTQTARPQREREQDIAMGLTHQKKRENRGTRKGAHPPEAVRVPRRRSVFEPVVDHV